MENRRQTIIVNKKFQYQYSVLVAALCVLLVNAFLIFDMLFGRALLELSTGAILAIAAVELVVVAGAWWASLLTTYRIAGPVYVFTREIARLAEGDFTANAVLRKGDLFQEEAWQINGSIESLRNQIDDLKSLALQMKGGTTEEQEAAQSQLIERISSFKTDD